MAFFRLGALLRERRGGRGVREIANEIGVSPATLSRVESGKLPDLVTFRKICAWLKISPTEILDMPSETVKRTTAAVHLRADVALSPEAANDLALLILVAQQELARRAQEMGSDVSPWI